MATGRKPAPTETVALVTPCGREGRGLGTREGRGDHARHEVLADQAILTVLPIDEETVAAVFDDDTTPPVGPGRMSVDALDVGHVL